MFLLQYLPPSDSDVNNSLSSISLGRTKVSRERWPPRFGARQSEGSFFMAELAAELIWFQLNERNNTVIVWWCSLRTEGMRILP